MGPLEALTPEYDFLNASSGLQEAQHNKDEIEKEVEAIRAKYIFEQEENGSWPLSGVAAKGKSSPSYKLFTTVFWLL